MKESNFHLLGHPAVLVAGLATEATQAQTLSLSLSLPEADALLALDLALFLSGRWNCGDAARLPC